MAALKLRWTQQALLDLSRTREWIALECPDKVGFVAHLLEKAMKALLQHPDLGRLGRLKGTRELIVSGTPFVIPYRMNKGAIHLLAILYGAKKWPDSICK